MLGDLHHKRICLENPWFILPIVLLNIIQAAFPESMQFEVTFHFKGGISFLKSLMLRSLKKVVKKEVKKSFD